ncbi:SNF2, N-terminal, partial [Dillenia turbinata]
EKMANDTQSSRTVKAESSCSKSKEVGGKGLNGSTTDMPNLRRSTRETSSANHTKSAGPRKSERLEKSTPTPATRKSERLEKHRDQNPLRRSARSKNPCSTSSLDSKKSGKSSGSSDIKNKTERRENSVQRSTQYASEVRTGKESDTKHASNRKIYGRFQRYVEGFEPLTNKVKGHSGEVKGPDKFSEEHVGKNKGNGSDQVEDVATENTEQFKEELRKDNFKMDSEKSTEGSTSSSKRMVEKRGNNHEDGELSNCSCENNSIDPHDSKDEDGLVMSKGSDNLSGIGQTTSSKRKMNGLDGNSNDSALGVSKYICTSEAGGIYSSPSSSTCFKRQRFDLYSAKKDQCFDNEILTQDQELCDALISKDRGEPEAVVTTGLAENDGDNSTCNKCKLGGELLYCGGKECKKSFHLSCLDPPLDDIPPGVWYCLRCVKKRIESGVHSVSRGIESIWDAREQEVSDGNGWLRQKQYFVKFDGLAHVHNLWVSEDQLLKEVPLLLLKFNRKDQVSNWKQEWTVPNRLLKKRKLYPQQLDEYQNKQMNSKLDCHCEWLVKWCGLDYEHLSWESENAPFLGTPEAKRLIEEYEDRCEKAKRVSDRSLVSEEKSAPLVKLSKLPGGRSSEFDIDHLNSINKLHEYRCKGLNAVMVDDEERVAKVVLFILSLQSDVCKPFLVITSSSAISQWEAEFSRLAPSLNVVTYSGKRDNRRNIRCLEFYEESGCIMFQVLLSTVDVIVEDLEELAILGWELVTIDECQRAQMSTNAAQIKMLASHMMLLLFSGLIKESICEYKKLLSILESNSEAKKDDCLKPESHNDIAQLKEKFSKYIVYESRSEYSRFAEYWVPVQISTVQLEQYCGTLLSNLFLLRSTSKTDPVGALKDILISTRKCCDHPYLVDPSVQSFLTKDLPEAEFLDVGIRACGKLQLLDAILSEIKCRGLRVLILFQSIGASVKVSIGDILDDFIRQRFGPDSYERVDGVGIVASKRQAALNKFNQKESGRFVFLLENRACLPSIKLSSIDSIIIYGSDLNPMNDLRGLQRIRIDSQFEQIKIFRLYTSFTMEEKVLLIAKQAVILDWNSPSIGTSHMLLMWGASYLFNKLDEFHGNHARVSNAEVSDEQSVVGNVVQEFLTLLLNGSDTRSSSSCIISKVEHNGGFYHGDVPLPGEKIKLTEEERPHDFWAKLLERRHPRWKYLSGRSQRKRKQVQPFDYSVQETDAENEVAKKRKKAVSSSLVPTSLTSSLGDKRKSVVEGTEGSPLDNCPPSLLKDGACASVSCRANHASMVPCMHAHVAEGAEFHMVEQKSFYLLLKPDILKLCDVLRLPDDVKFMAGNFLEYVVNNHHVSQEPVTIFQAFQIALCWNAASLVKYKVDHKGSVELAQRNLNFCCKEEEVDMIHSKMRELRKLFSQRLLIPSPKSQKDQTSMSKDIRNDLLVNGSSQSTLVDQQKVKVEVEERSPRQDWSYKQGPHLGQTIESDIRQRKIWKAIKKIEKKCYKRMTSLILKQQQEVNELYMLREKETADLENDHRVQSAVFRSMFTSNYSARVDNLKMLDNNFARKMADHKHQMEIRLRDLEARHLVERNREQERKVRLLAKIRAGVHDKLLIDPLLHGSGGEMEALSSDKEAGLHGKLLTEPPLHGPVREVEKLPCSKESGACDDVENATSVSGCLLRGQRSKAELQAKATAGVHGKILTESPLHVVVGESPSSKEAGAQDDQENAASASGCLLKEQQWKVELLAKATGGVPGELSTEPPLHDSVGELESLPSSKEAGAGKDLENTASAFEQLLEEQCPHGINKGEPQGREIPSEIPKMVIQPEASCTENVEMETVASERAPIAVSEQPTLAATSGDDPENVVSMNAPSLKEQILNEVSPNEATGKEPIEAQETAAVAPVEVCRTTAVEVEEIEITDTGNARMGDDGANLFEVVLERPVLAGVDTQDGPSCSVNNISPFVEQSLVTLPLMQPQVTASQVDASHLVQGVQEEDCLASTNTEAGEIEVAIGQLQTPSMGDSLRQDLGPISEGRTAFEVAGAPIQAQGPINIPVLHQPHALAGELGALVSDNSAQAVNPEIVNRRTLPSVVSRVPMTLFADPLQKELERIRMETDRAVKIHEDKKFKLRSDCEKEIEEIVAQIRQKYEALIQEAENAFQLKKSDLDTIQNTVLMNKILAEAFRSKCMDPKSPGAPGIQQAAPPSHMRQLLQLPLQRGMERNPLAASSTSVTTPAVGPQTSYTHVQVHSSTVLAPVIAPAADPQSASPPIQVHHSTELMSSMTTRPVLISPVTPPATNLQVGSEIRFPAPHLQAFRPLASAAVTNPPLVPRGISSQHPTFIQAVNALPQGPVQPPLRPTHDSNTYNSAHGPENVGGYPTFNKTSLSALELLVDVDSRPNANASNFVPSLAGISATIDTPEQSQSSMPGDPRANLPRTDVATEVVCLSDDE